MERAELKTDGGLSMGKRAYILKLLQDIRASYWFLPTVLVFGGLLLAGIMGWVDRNATLLPVQLPTTFIDTQADGARSTLAVIAQSIIGVAGVTFSMTLVAVSFASGNFGPRLIGNFMRDRGNQWCLGILISTFVYALVVLRTVQDGIDGGAAEYVPQYSLIVALLLMLLCVFTLIFFIHHVPETINVSRISANIGASLEQQIRDLIDDRQRDDDARREQAPDRSPDKIICSSTSGYIQTVNFGRLSDIAQDNDWHIALATPIGSFATAKTPVLHIWADNDIDEEALDQACGCFAVGISRTENQNPTFLAQQLVEMAARALSPGVNDPYTAMDCLNRMAAALTLAATYKTGLQPPSLPRVSLPHLTFEGLFSATFPLCRQYIKPDAMTLAHALGLLQDLIDVVPKADRLPLETEIRMLRSAD